MIIDHTRHSILVIGKQYPSCAFCVRDTITMLTPYFFGILCNHMISLIPVTKIVCNGECNYIDPIKVEPLTRTIFEGGSISLDVSYQVSTVDRTVTIDWGDGDETTISSIGEGRLFFTDTHDYRQDGSYTVMFTITTSAGEIITEQTTITVINVAPAISDATLSTLLTRDEVSLDVTFTDPGVEDSHTISINWGDGTPADIILSDSVSLSTTATISKDHIYGMAGIYLVSAIVTDSKGATSSEESSVVTVYGENADFATSARIEEISDINGAMVTAFFNVRGYLDSDPASGKLQLSDDAEEIFESTTIKTAVIGPDNIISVVGEGKFINGVPGEWIGNDYAFEASLADGPDAVMLYIYNVSFVENPIGNDDFKLFVIDEGTVVRGDVVRVSTASASQAVLTEPFMETSEPLPIETAEALPTETTD